MSGGSEGARVTQDEVRGWFDGTYRSAGFDYLRPLEAYTIFVQLLGAQPGEELLDVACGPGLLLKAAQLWGVQATGVDLSGAALELAQRYVPEARVREANAEELPFPDESFDHVTCVGAIERFFDRPKALAEMRRVSRPGGRFCFMVRNSRTLIWRLWREALRRRNTQGHQDALDLDAWGALFDRVGFEVESVHPDQYLRQKLRKLLRLGRARDLRAPEPVARSFLPLRYANEFVFVLRKKADATP